MLIGSSTMNSTTSSSIAPWALLPFHFLIILPPLFHPRAQSLHHPNLRSRTIHSKPPRHPRSARTQAFPQQKISFVSRAQPTTPTSPRSWIGGGTSGTSTSFRQVCGKSLTLGETTAREEGEMVRAMHFSLDEGPKKQVLEKPCRHAIITWS